MIVRYHPASTELKLTDEAARHEEQRRRLLRELRARWVAFIQKHRGRTITELKRFGGPL